MARAVAAVHSVVFAGAVLRPHAAMALSLRGRPAELLRAAEDAGHQLAARDRISDETLAAVSRPVVGQEA